MNQKYEATINTATGSVKHKLGVNGLETSEEFPVAVRLEISASDDGIFLLRFDGNGDFCGDTWHQTIKEAKDQALFEFNITEEDWRTVGSA